MHTFDLSLEHMTKVEGAAGFDLKVKNDKVTESKFKITEYKRFYTEAIKGQAYAAVPTLLSRVCGTCSNAHLLCAIKAIEDALEIVPSKQTKILRTLTYDGLIIRDHALHLYLFVMPDIFGKDAFLDFDESDEEQHQLLHDAFEIKAAGNFLATIIAGRSVHGVFPIVGGFAHLPERTSIEEAIEKLKAARPAVVRLIELMAKIPFHMDRQTNYMALVGEEKFNFLEGAIKTNKGEAVEEKDFRALLEKEILPYSQGSAYNYKGEPYMVGSLARVNLAKETLHPETQKSAAKALELFPSTDIFHNNLAQAIEILHCLDEAIELLQSTTLENEAVIKGEVKESTGVGVIEAPRGTLYHRIVLGADGKVKEGEIIVPTGQNQVNIEADVAALVEELIKKDLPKEKMSMEIEKLIRAYDPCMSCGAHFLRVNWL